MAVCYTDDKNVSFEAQRAAHLTERCVSWMWRGLLWPIYPPEGLKIQISYMPGERKPTFEMKP
jgi:hypothetical protein